MPQPLLHDLVIDVRAPTVCLSGTDGQIRPTGAQGVLCGDVRVLDRAVVTVDGAEPEPVTARFGLVRGQAARRSGATGHDPALWLRRDREVRADGIRERYALVNQGPQAVAVELAVVVGADLARIETIKRGVGTTAVVPAVTGDGLRWSNPEVDVTLSAPGATVTAGELRWQRAVPAGGEAYAEWTVHVRDRAPVVAAARTRLVRPARSADPQLARLQDRSFADLDGLLVTEPGGTDLVAAAGAPWYLTLFGRDALWTATMLLDVDVRIAAGTLRTLARLQGTRTDPETAEQPGKIIHERRRGAGDHGAGTVLPPLYYGTIDATPLWITLLRDAWRAGMTEPEVVALLPNLRAALSWVRDHADRDGDGFAEYWDESGHGLANQGWKDSADSVRFAGGQVALGPIALVEVQGYLYEAMLAGAELLEALAGEDVTHWRSRAAALRTLFRERFWVADASGPFPAIALDGAKRPVDALTSGIGHLLGTGILDDAESATVGERLLRPDMAAGFGLRTMSSDAGGYAPFSYHRGSVWPHDTAIVVRGLVRSGQDERAALLAGQLVTAAASFDWRLPELYAGFGAAEVATPVPYPAACRPQAWSAASVAVVTRALTGRATR